MKNDNWLSDLADEARLATADHFLFARFVKHAKQVGDIKRILLEEDTASRYAAAWFQLEIVNALALGAWEDNGKPEIWLNEWRESYQQDAEEVVSEFLAVVDGLT